MDPNFFQWMMCQHQPNTAKNAETIMKSLFADKKLELDNMSDFADGDKMVQFLNRFILDRSPAALGGILCDKKCENSQTAVDKIAGTTVYSQCRAFVWYLKFLGFTYVELDMLVLKIGGRSANFQQGSILEKIFDPIPQITIINQVLQFIRKMQIEAHIKMDIIYANSTKTHLTYRKDGVQFFLPFLELLIRFYVYPTTTIHIKQLRACMKPSNWAKKLTTESKSSTSQRHGTFQFIKIDDRIFVRWHYHVSGAARPRTYLPSYRDINQTVSRYIFFFMKYCSNPVGNGSERIRYKENAGEFRLVFPSSSYTNSWKLPVRDVNTFCHQNNMSPLLMKSIGLGTNRYAYVSRLMRVAIDATEDTSATIRNIYTMGLSMAIHKTSGRYGGIKQLEDNDLIVKEIEKFKINNKNLIGEIISIPDTLLDKLNHDMNATMFPN